MYTKQIIAAFAFVAGAVAQSIQVQTPASIQTCVPVQITWTGGTAPFFLSIIPGGQTTAAALIDFGTVTASPYTWTDSSLAAGTVITIKLTDSTGVTVYSAEDTIQSGSTTCFTSGGGSSSTAASSTTGTLSSGAVVASTASSAAASSILSSASSAASSASAAGSMSSSLPSSAMVSSSAMSSSSASSMSMASSSMGTTAAAGSSMASSSAAAASSTSSKSGAQATGIAAIIPIAVGIIGGAAALF